jgi:putative cardiolipin synthase
MERRFRFRFFHPIVLLLTVLYAGGCASIPFDHRKTPTFAIPPSHETRLWKGLQPELERNEGKSGFFLMPSGMDAFASRYYLIETADRSLDLQYFMFHDDATGLVLVERLLAAANRGVRVRLLFDDWHVTGKDFELSMLSSHPNIKIRIFNPFSWDRTSELSRFLEAVMAEKRLQRRMHNKVFIADNTVAVVGGRNMGNEYFDASADVNFSDLDIMMAGPIVHRAAAAFDQYWNSDLTIPIEALASGRPGREDIREGEARLRAVKEKVKGSKYEKDLRASDFLARLRSGTVPFVWAEGIFLSDKPVKVRTQPSETPTAYLAPILDAFGRTAVSEVLIMTPYFVPGREGVEVMKAQRERGVKIKILTNSLASTDVKAVHGAYARYRKDLLRIGVELFEMKPEAGDAPKERRRERSGSSRGALHAKTYILDRELVFVGSYNMDYRSRTLNTESGIGIMSPEIAEQAAHLFESRTTPEKSYRLVLVDDDGNPGGKEGEQTIAWVTEEEGRKVVYDEEPMTDFWDRLFVKIMTWLIPEDIL